MSEYTRYLLGTFVRALPWLVGLWLIGTVGIALWFSVLEGADLGESLRTGITFLPVAVPLTPLIFVKNWRAARTPKALQAIGLSIGWAVVTFPLAVGATVLLANLLGVN